MTTAEIMFAQPGDPTIDHQHNARKILWALLAAILIHLLFAYLLAVLGGVFTPALPIEEKPVELTFVDLRLSRSSQRIQLSSRQMSPKNRSSCPTRKHLSRTPIPSQRANFRPLVKRLCRRRQGKDRPLVDLETHAYSLQMNGAQPQPSAAPQENSRPPLRRNRPCNHPRLPLRAIRDVDRKSQFGANPSVAPASAQPRSAYRAYKERTQT